MTGEILQRLSSTMNSRRNSLSFARWMTRLRIGNAPTLYEVSFFPADSATLPEPLRGLGAGLALRFLFMTADIAIRTCGSSSHGIFRPRLTPLGMNVTRATRNLRSCALSQVETRNAEFAESLERIAALWQNIQCSFNERRLGTKRDFKFGEIENETCGKKDSGFEQLDTQF